MQSRREYGLLAIGNWLLGAVAALVEICAIAGYILRHKSKRIVYCFINIFIVLPYTIQRVCQNTKGIDYQRYYISAVVQECKETLQKGVKEIDRGIWQGRQIADATVTKISLR